MSDFDEEMQRALELSAQMHMATCTNLVLEGELEVRRGELSAPCSQHWRGPCSARGGLLLQADTLNQFAQHWAPLIREFDTPSATCGYMAVANLLVLQRSAPTGGTWTRGQLDELLRALRAPDTLQPIVREVMAFVAGSRADWMAKHPADFPTPFSRKKYSSAWVANYEISDFLQREASRGALRPALPLFFARYNQWPQRSEATHEELVRLAEERPFGGSSDAAGRVQLAWGDALFVVESFLPERRLSRPEEFLQAWDPGERPPHVPGLFLADLNGHFVACAAVHLETVGGAAEPAVVVFNTTGTRYLDNPTCAFIFDLAHPPLPEPAPSESLQGHPAHEHPLHALPSEIGQGGDAVPSLTAVAQIVDMGFAEGRAQEALSAAGGDVAQALELLLQSA
mmetsp:Transcript_42447/g.132009  ORF Transcript_42447/g.132009 Transcript_42447/m.132009 type:complete len:398 (-) Transcript_42447:66-1259(-)